MGFQSVHPWVQFVLFIVILAVTMSNPNPVILFLSLIGAILFLVKLEGIRRTLRQVLFYIPVLILCSGINVLFNHRGMTVIGTFRNNSITLESLFYGLSFGVMLITVLIWFRLIRRIVTLDRVLYLTGAGFPYLTLLLSMSFRMVDRLSEQGRQMMRVQSTQSTLSSTPKSKFRQAVYVMSGLTGQTMEDSLDTAAAMRARGYGCGRRTNYSRYRMRGNHVAYLLSILLICVIVFLSCYGRGNTVLYFPRIRIPAVSAFQMSGMIGFGILCVSPFVIEVIGGRRCRRTK